MGCILFFSYLFELFFLLTIYPFPTLMLTRLLIDVFAKIQYANLLLAAVVDLLSVLHLGAATWVVDVLCSWHKSGS